MSPTSLALLSFMALLQAVLSNPEAGGWYVVPAPLYPSSGKRHHLPYHPVARFRGADTPRGYFPYEHMNYPDYVPNNYIPSDGTETKLSAGEILNLLAYASSLQDGNKIRSTMRFGIVR